MSDELREQAYQLCRTMQDRSPQEIADAAIALIRAETLEEAARECGLSSVGLHFAAAIRALKERT